MLSLDLILSSDHGSSRCCEIPHQGCVNTVSIFSLPVLSSPSQLSPSHLYEMRSWTSSDLIQKPVLRSTAAIAIVDRSLLQTFSSVGPHDTTFSVFL